MNEKLARSGAAFRTSSSFTMFGNTVYTRSTAGHTSSYTTTFGSDPTAGARASPPTGR